MSTAVALRSMLNVTANSQYVAVIWPRGSRFDTDTIPRPKTIGCSLPILFRIYFIAVKVTLAHYQWGEMHSGVAEGKIGDHKFQKDRTAAQPHTTSQVARPEWF